MNTSSGMTTSATGMPNMATMAGMAVAGMNPAAVQALYQVNGLMLNLVVWLQRGSFLVLDGVKYAMSSLCKCVPSYVC